MGSHTDYRIDKEHTHGIRTHEHRIGSRNNKNNKNNLLFVLFRLRYKKNELFLGLQIGRAQQLRNLWKLR